MGTTAASMVAGTLYTYPDNFRAFKALIAAKYSGAQLTVAKDFVFGETNKKPEFLKKFPLGKVPAFEGSDGVLLTESNAIAYYVANDELRGGSDAPASSLYLGLPHDGDHAVQQDCHRESQGGHQGCPQDSERSSSHQNFPCW